MSDPGVGEEPSVVFPKLTPDQESSIRIVIAGLQKRFTNLGRLGQPGMMTSQDVMNELNDSSHNAPIIVFSHSNDDLRNGAATIGSQLYRARSSSPGKYPQVSLVFDEADEFIPQETPKQNESYRHSRGMAEAVSRRGRKYRIGPGISTQRIVYLHTNIMAQMQTCFVSRLPCRTNRDKISEAFILSEQEFEQTNAFDIGEWLLVSHHNAVGTRNVPIPVRLQDANTRVLKFLQTYKRT